MNNKDDGGFDPLIGGGLGDDFNATPVKAAKKSSNMAIIAILVPFVAFGAWQLRDTFSSGSDEAPQAQVLPTTNVITEAPPVSAQAPIGDISADAFPTDKPADINAAAPVAAVAPDAGATLKPNETVAAALVAAPVATLTPVSTPIAAPVAAVAPVAAPAPVAVVAPAEVKPALTADASPYAHKTDIDQINTRLDRMEGMINKLAAAIEKMPPANVGYKELHQAEAAAKKTEAVASSEQAVPAKPKRKVVRAKPVAKVEETSLAVKETPINLNVEKVANANDEKFTSHVVIPGRAWVVDKEGTFSTVVVGDSVPNVGKVKSINVDTGEIAIEGGSSIRMRGE